MLLACLAVGLISCRDTIDPREAKPPSAVQQQEASGPVTVLRLTCTLSFPDGQKGEVSCGESGAGKKGVSQSVILPWYSAYAVWLPFNLVKDTTTETWTFIASVKNLLGQPIGTLDGTTAVGTKVFITYGPVATQGTGDVWITNADGTANFTAPDQKYFNYPWVIDPQEISPYREWKTHVPNTVTEVTMGVSISTDFPAEQNVAASSPDTTPAWFNDDTSWVDGGMLPNGFLKNIVSVIFKAGTSLADKQLAVALVDGNVVGGTRFSTGDGYYYLFIQDDGTGTKLREAAQKLSTLPQVEAASVQLRAFPAYLKPHDGQGWTSWKLSPDATGSGQNWALEAINAPMAWGCSTGDPATWVGIVDHAFDSTEVASNVISGSSFYGKDPTDSVRHGGGTSAIVAASGNNNDYITGVMWRAGLLLDDPGASPLPQQIIKAASIMGGEGARAVNLSWQMVWKVRPSPASHQDSVRAQEAFRTLFAPALRRERNSLSLALLVISAGNSNLPAYFSLWPMLRDSVPAVVVGASTSGRQRWVYNQDTASNYGGHVDIYAPGADVYTLSRIPGQNTQVIPATGTSFSAPYVTGVTGLLSSFDPNITTDSLRSYVLQGAIRGGRTVAEPVGTKPLLDAYESLKLAAERPGAPLCGNHVWVAGHTVGSTDFDTVVVQRGSGVTERIWGNDPEGTIAILNVQHGGHRISYHGATEYRAIEYNPLTRKWQAALPDDSLPVVSDGGTYNSYRWTSHDGDSSLVYSTATQRTPTVTIKLYDSHAGTTNPLATVPTLLTTPIFTDSVCVRLYREENKCQGYAGVGEKQEANVLAAYSPMGDTAIVSVARTQFSSIGISAWALCDTVVIHHPDSTTSVNHYDCRAVDYQKNSVDTKFYKLPINTVTNNPTASWTMDSVRATQLAVTEDGSELAAGYGTIDVLGDAQGFTNCSITYRNLRTGQESPPIPSEPACVFFGAVTASPLRRPGITLQARE